MKVLLIKPMEHPQVVDIENSLKEFYRILNCDCITATYPWEERAALVTDDNGLFTEKSFSRYIPELEQPIKGNFFICGLGEEDFAELPQDLIRKFRERFWVPEAFISMFGQMSIIRPEKTGRAWLNRRSLWDTGRCRLMARGNTAADTFWVNTNGRETTARR